MAPSMDTLKAFAGREEVNHDAPVRAKVSIVIEAPRDTVWRTLARLEHWHLWMPSIRALAPATHLKEQDAFSWRSRGMTVTSEVVRVRDGHAAAWVGRGLGARAVHVWRLTELSPTTTRVETEESMDGALIKWLFGSAKLHDFLMLWLQHLKAACEK
jgi:uncharacterized protein YndB with AHSA1/START domain